MATQKRVDHVAEEPELGGRAILFAAGSLQAVMDEIIRRYREQGGHAFKAVYGPSDKLRETIAAGADVDVFASASLDHLEVLVRQDVLGAACVFAHNDLCVVARPQLELRKENLLDVLCDPSVRVATSTPSSDPMGDYTWQFFQHADKVRPGFLALLETKARKLSGAHIPAPSEKLPYISAFENDRTDTYVMYCTNAVLTKKALPELDVVRIPAVLNVCGTYGIAAGLQSAGGRSFVQFVLGPVAQQILRKHGFKR